ncbi:MULTISPECIES: hypothetical protein [Vibrio harveyi group]|uniref:Uncharacterized protein n=1 Tax=Vibrio owensii CAIM 1854 = LMG 25443 TaxID=1229493 RepID=A0A0C1Z775_9VIBR|nr:MULTISPECIES: hypothetical protein [Vibrio harveyi group]KIF52009.1 hypothetical protein H735_16505 [Vibrio owensii CAIM 1854 = LMG 25443]HCZ9277715.1 hypothetical protein [Vibrio alginolyticus]
MIKNPKMSLSKEDIDEFSLAIFEAREKVKLSSQGIVKKKLHSFIGDSSNEHIDMAEDFLSDATISLLKGIKSEKTEFFDTEDKARERQLVLWQRYKDSESYLAKCLHQAVIRACNTRLKRWSLDTEADDTDYDDLISDEYLLEMRSKEVGKKFAVRARSSRPNDDLRSDEEWMTSNSSVLQVEGAVVELKGIDRNRLIDLMNQRRVNSKEQSVIFARLSGESLEHIALVSREKVDTIEKRYHRGLGKLGLTTKDLKF